MGQLPFEMVVGYLKTLEKIGVLEQVNRQATLES